MISQQHAWCLCSVLLLTYSPIQAEGSSCVNIWLSNQNIGVGS